MHAVGTNAIDNKIVKRFILSRLLNGYPRNGEMQQSRAELLAEQRHEIECRNCVFK